MRENGEALIIKTEQYSDVLKAMQRDTKLVDLGANVHSIRRSRTGEMILELKHNKERKDITYKNMVEEVLGEGIKMSALTAEAPLKVKNLEKITDAEEIVTALRQECEAQVATAAVRTQISFVELPVVDTNKFLREGKLKVGLSVYIIHRRRGI